MFTIMTLDVTYSKLRTYVRYVTGIEVKLRGKLMIFQRQVLRYLHIKTENKGVAFRPSH